MSIENKNETLAELVTPEVVDLYSPEFPAIRKVRGLDQTPRLLFKIVEAAESDEILPEPELPIYATCTEITYAPAAA